MSYYNKYLKYKRKFLKKKFLSDQKSKFGGMNLEPCDGPEQEPQPPSPSTHLIARPYRQKPQINETHPKARFQRLIEKSTRPTAQITETHPRARFLAWSESNAVDTTNIIQKKQELQKQMAKNLEIIRERLNISLILKDTNTHFRNNVDKRSKIKNFLFKLDAYVQNKLRVSPQVERYFNFYLKFNLPQYMMYIKHNFNIVLDKKIGTGTSSIIYTSKDEKGNMQAVSFQDEPTYNFNDIDLLITLNKYFITNTDGSKQEIFSKFKYVIFDVVRWTYCICYELYDCDLYTYLTIIYKMREAILNNMREELSHKMNEMTSLRDEEIAQMREELRYNIYVHNKETQNVLSQMRLTSRKEKKDLYITERTHAMELLSNKVEVEIDRSRKKAKHDMELLSKKVKDEINLLKGKFNNIINQIEKNLNKKMSVLVDQVAYICFDIKLKNILVNLDKKKIIAVLDQRTLFNYKTIVLHDFDLFGCCKINTDESSMCNLSILNKKYLILYYKLILFIECKYIRDIYNPKSNTYYLYQQYFQNISKKQEPEPDLEPDLDPESEVQLKTFFEKIDSSTRDYFFDKLYIYYEHYLLKYYKLNTFIDDSINTMEDVINALALNKIFFKPL